MSGSLPAPAEGVWLFNGSRRFPRFPSGVFRRPAGADSWAAARRLTGTVTWYPLGIAAYDWAVANKFFAPQKEEHRQADFIERFSDARQPHWHYQLGVASGALPTATETSLTGDGAPSSSVWVFLGSRLVGVFPSGVFDTRQTAEAWIASRMLSGILTEYPVDVGVYDWAVERGWFRPTSPIHNTPEFIGSFTSTRQEQYYYCDGELAAG